MDKDEKHYCCPEAVIIEIRPEGPLCWSMEEDEDIEGLGKNDGDWGW